MTTQESAGAEGNNDNETAKESHRTAATLKKLRVAALREVLGAQGLLTTGRKADLIERLLEADKQALEEAPKCAHIVAAAVPASSESNGDNADAAVVLVSVGTSFLDGAGRVLNVLAVRVRRDL